MPRQATIALRCRGGAAGRSGRSRAAAAKLLLRPGHPTAHPQIGLGRPLSHPRWDSATGEQRRIICAVFKVIGDVQVLRLDYERWAGAAHRRVRMRRRACCPDGTQGMLFTARAGRWEQRASTHGAIDRCACFANATTASH